MAMQWSNTLSVGIEEIDEQHKELFKRINALYDAMNQGKGQTEVGRVLSFLEDYVLIHFGVEEAYMIQYDYPSYPAHKELHKDFIEDLGELKGKFNKEGASVSLIILLNIRVGNWLVKHIGRVDKTLGLFLRKEMR